MKLLQDVRASYWFLPTVMAFFAVVLAKLTLYFDHNSLLLTDAWRLTQVEGARSTLAVISQSIIGVTGVMFSMTIVAVSFASGNFGPRLIGNFMRDRGNQLSLGLLIATFVYTLLILRAVQASYGTDDVSGAFVPHLSMLVAFGLTGVSVLTMIYYVHHIPEIINVSNISADLGGRLRLGLETLIRTEAQGEDQQECNLPQRPAEHQVFLNGDGYLQTWDRNRLAELADDHDLYFELLFTAGSFVTKHSPALNVWTQQDISDDLESDIRSCFALGHIPTEQQNLLFIGQQLVEMIARALSPGVNDPYTAINCLNWLYVGLITAANFEGGLKARHFERLRYPTLDFDKLFDASITVALPYIRTDPLVSDHLNTLLMRLVAETDNEDVLTATKKTRNEVSGLQK